MAEWVPGTVPKLKKRVLPKPVKPARPKRPPFTYGGFQKTGEL